MTRRPQSLADLPQRYHEGSRIRDITAKRFPIFHSLGVDAPKKPRKYRNTPTVIDGQRFDSKLESRCYLELRLRLISGDVQYFLRQIAFPLEGGVVYRCDFFAVLTAGGVEVIDATGMMTAVKRNKLKQVKARYGVDVKLWGRKGI